MFIGITPARRFLINSSGRALIKTGQSCGIAVPLTAILYGSAGTVVQVIRRARVETRRVETGLMAAGQVEIKEGLVEGDIVVARGRRAAPRRRSGARGDGGCGSEINLGKRVGRNGEAYCADLRVVGRITASPNRPTALRSWFPLTLYLGGPEPTLRLPLLFVLMRERCGLVG